MLDPAKALKDIVLLGGFGLLFVGVGAELRRVFFRDSITKAIFVYAVITVGLALVKAVDQDAEILGVVNNLRFLLFFLYFIELSSI